MLGRRPRGAAPFSSGRRLRNQRPDHDVALSALQSARFATAALTHLNYPIARTHLVKLAKDRLFGAEARTYFPDVKADAIEPRKQFDRDWP